jgi:hypothetical protein
MLMAPILFIAFHFHDFYSIFSHGAIKGREVRMPGPLPGDNGRR